jgi:pSer/pThr/pTyr-binding forkhead associated (FHA) protein
MQVITKHTLKAKLNQLDSTPNVDDAMVRSRGQNPFLRFPLATSGWLLGLDGFHFGEDFRLYPGANTIGSSARSDLIITGPEVSRHHATLEVLSGESAILYPGHTEKSLSVNGSPCHSPTPLCHADQITLGSQTFAYISLIAGRNEINKPILLKKASTLGTQITSGWLIELKGEKEGRDFRLKFGENRLGTQTGLEIVLNDPSIQKRHAVITRHTDNWTIVPVSVTEPLSINGSVSTGDVLTNANILSFGGTEFIFRPLNIGWMS